MALESAIKEVTEELRESLALHDHRKALELTRELEGLLALIVHDSFPIDYECE